MVIIELWKNRGIIRPNFGRVNEKLGGHFACIAVSVLLPVIANLRNWERQQEAKQVR